MNPISPRIIVVIGPTASGKSEYAVKLAKKYNGEIISADSRQVYKGLDIGTGKVEGNWKKVKTLSLRGANASERRGNLKDKIATSQTPRNDKSPLFMYKGIRHHCIDFVSPKRQYTVADFKRDGTKAIKDIFSRGKVAIICGGTGQFVDALILNPSIPEVLPDPAFRKKMAGKTTLQLFSLLKRKDPARAGSIDPHNPRRLIRALEIIHTTGKPVPKVVKQPLSTIIEESHAGAAITVNYLNPSRDILFKSIEKRLNARINLGMLNEVKELRDRGVSWKRLDALGLEYRFVSRYFRGTKSKQTNKQNVKGFVESLYYQELLSEIKHYAKRQQTWFKKYIPIAKLPL